MEKIVFKNVEEITIESITNDSIVGLSNNKLKVGVFEDNNNNYIGVGNNSMNFRSKWSKSTKQSYIKAYLENNNNFEAYAFNSYSEFYK